MTRNSDSFPGWLSFLRNRAVFENCSILNHPARPCLGRVAGVLPSEDRCLRRLYTVHQTSGTNRCCDIGCCKTETAIQQLLHSVETLARIQGIDVVGSWSTGSLVCLGGSVEAACSPIADMSSLPRPQTNGSRSTHGDTRGSRRPDVFAADQRLHGPRVGAKEARRFRNRRDVHMHKSCRGTTGSHGPAEYGRFLNAVGGHQQTGLASALPL